MKALNVCCLTLLLLSFATASYAKVVHSERSLYRNLEVEDSSDLRCLKFNSKRQQSQQSCLLISEPNRLVFNYTKLLLTSLLLNNHPKHILIIGLGGGTMSNTLRQLLPQSTIDNVEIDAAVINVARKYFSYFENERINTINQDGRIFIKRAGFSKHYYDLIILDAFNGDYIPEHLLTKEFLQETLALLSEEGVLASNTFSVSQLYQHESATYQAVFGEFYNVRDQNKGNRIILASKKLPPALLIDNNARHWKAKFKRFGVNVDALRAAMKIEQDWPENTRVLTDQFSPANLLKNN